LRKHGAESKGVFNGMNPGRGGNIVFRTGSGGRADILRRRQADRGVAGHRRSAYDFYTKNKKMPNLIGKALVRDYESSADMLFMTEVRDDSLVQIQPDGAERPTEGVRSTYAGGVVRPG
jgi:hypothetical protein